MQHELNRKKDFRRIKGSVPIESIRFAASNALLVEGDSLSLLKLLPDHSVSLILTDPPYHTTKKDNIYGDTSFIEDQHYLEWMSKYATEWRRILKPNGSMFCFCAPSMAAHLELIFKRDFNVLSQVVWTKPNDPGFDGWKQKMKKEALRHWYAHTERIIFAEPAFEGNLHRSYFGNLLRQLRTQSGLTMHQLTAAIGAHGRVNHGGAVSNWEAGRNIPSREQYAKLCSALLKIRRVNSIPCYEDAIRPFRVDSSKEFTDVWSFPSVRPYKGKHPAEKPLSMLEHAIEATTYPGDIVLDCFAGSGNTALAALKLGRLTIAMEIEPIWTVRIGKRVALAAKDSKAFWRELTKSIAGSKTVGDTHEELPLFVGSR